MKVVAFNGSPRRGGNTEILITRVLNTLESKGIDSELVNITGEPIRGCTACMWCRNEKTGRCKFDDDIVNSCISKMIEADGIIIGSPTYFSNINAETKALIDRGGYASRGAGKVLKGKVGAGVVAVRRAGAMNVFNSINNFFLINEMIIIGSSYWNIGQGREVGEVENDAEGLQTMETLGKNMSWLLKKLNK